MTAPGPLDPTRTMTLTSSGGTTLHAEAFVPEAPRAVALMVHGYAEHCGRYREVAHVLHDAGCAVLGFDVRGHGRSSGKRGFIGSFREYREDLDAARAAAAALAPGAPLFLVAHSNGSLISLAALTDAVPFACVGAVLSSPFLALRLAVPAPKIWLARAASTIYPAFSQKNDLRPTDLTSDPAKQAERVADTLCHDVASARWFTEARAAQAKVEAHAGRIAVPTLWLIGGDDPIADPVASERIARTVPGADVRVLAGYKHEVWNERERSVPLAALAEFARTIAG
ncbi:MAG: alpha/beta hydrolase [Myxococcales bacterium]|nr:alpha/beta hydrolase [Myxococcales bacterium]